MRLLAAACSTERSFVVRDTHVIHPRREGDDRHVVEDSDLHAADDDLVDRSRQFQGT